MSWISPIYDRTQQDILDLTKKGYLNFEDMNRIEGNIEVLANIFNVPINPRIWVMADYFKVSEFQRIMGSLAEIMVAYPIPPPNSIPVLPINHYEKINVIEKIVFDIYSVWEANKKNILYASEFSAGESIGVI